MTEWFHLKLEYIMDYILEMICVSSDFEKKSKLAIFMVIFQMIFVWILDGTTFFRDGTHRCLAGFI